MTTFCLQKFREIAGAMSLLTGLSAFSSGFFKLMGQVVYSALIFT